MGKDTEIAWCDSTFNPWWGCQRVSPGCENCYAETWAKRTGANLWGPAKTTPRRTMSAKYWEQPFRWNDAAAREGVRRRVFCGSMCDVFEDHPTVNGERDRLWDVIVNTSHLDWLLLTKRPENIRDRLPQPWGTLGIGGWPNVWIGTSVENQEQTKRIDHLWGIPATVNFLSLEPLLGPIDIEPYLNWAKVGGAVGLPWVIVGGESGPKARPCEVWWVREIVEACQDYDVPVFVKQLGTNAQMTGCDGTLRLRLKDKKGGDPAEWDEEIRIREFPR